MGKTLDWVREESTGRLFYRRAFPADLRQFLKHPRRELKVPLGARKLMTAEAFAAYERAKRQFDDEASEARAAQTRHLKAAAGSLDPLTHEAVAYIASVFTREWHLVDEAALRARGADWAGRTREGWDWLLSDFQQWRAEADVEAMEDHWGATANRLLSAEGLVVDPHDAEGRERLLWALNDAALALSSDAIARTKGRVVPVPAKAERPANPRGRSRTVQSLMDAYKAAKWEGWSKSSQTAVTPVFRLLTDTLADREAQSITREDARALMALVQRLPAGLGRKAALKGLTVPAAIDRGAELCLPTIAPGTVNLGYLAHISAMFAWAEAEEWTTKNPFKGLLVHDPVADQDKRDPFSLSQLQKLFSSAPWDSPLSADATRPGRFWVPLIALFSGMRLGEAAGLRLMDVEEVDGLPAFNLRPYEGRTLKNRESRREVPVHSELVSLGLLAFVEARRHEAAPDDLLFPDGKANVRGQWGAKLGEWFVGHLLQQEITGIKLGVHSFRHSFEDRLRAAGLHATPVGLRLTGRKALGSAAGYGDGFTLADRREALERVTYPGLELSHLQSGA